MINKALEKEPSLRFRRVLEIASLLNNVEFRSSASTPIRKKRVRKMKLIRQTTCFALLLTIFLAPATRMVFSQGRTNPSIQIQIEKVVDSFALSPTPESFGIIGYSKSESPQEQGLLFKDSDGIKLLNLNQERPISLLSFERLSRALRQVPGPAIKEPEWKNVEFYVGDRLNRIVFTIEQNILCYTRTLGEIDKINENQ